MNQKLAAFSKEFNLKGFYSLISYDQLNALSEAKQDLLADLAPFLRKFASTYINYFELKHLPPLSEAETFENRLDEFYADLAIRVSETGIDGTILWLLTQKASEQRLFFPSKPVVKNYSDISRGLNLLDELLKHVSISDNLVYNKLLEHITAILSPRIDESFEKQGTDLLGRLQEFNTEKEGVAPDAFKVLCHQISSLNEEIELKLMSNNVYVSLGQQINEINKALKTIFKKDAAPIFENDAAKLEQFWNGLKSVGYAGGNHRANGSFLDHLNRIHTWLNQDFPGEKETILKFLEAANKTPQLPTLAREPIPEAIQIYALKLLGTVGLRNDQAIRQVLGFYSRFVGKMVRDAALYTLRKNSESVRHFFYQRLDVEPDYDQKMIIAEKHDSIFDEIYAESLTLAFGDSYTEALRELDDILEHNGFLLSNFIKSAFMKLPGTDSKTSGLNGQLQHFKYTNHQLRQFKQFVETRAPGVFIQLLGMWGLNYIVSWSLADYQKEKRLFEFIIKAATDYEIPVTPSKDQVIPLNSIIQLLTPEPDARSLIEKLMTFLLNSKISFDFPLFQSLFRVVAQRYIQLDGNIVIRDGFSEQRGYTDTTQIPENGSDIELLDPHIFQPIVVFLITVLKMKAVNIPKDAFIETDISLYLNTLSAKPDRKRLGYEVYLAHQLISSIPYIVDFASKHESIIRKTIADLDESYNRTNILVHYQRLKIHRAPSKLDLTYCLETLEGLSNLDLDLLFHRLTGLMKGIGDEAIPDLEHYFELYRDKLLRLGTQLRALKTYYPDTPWHHIAESSDFEKQLISLPDLDEESQRDILTLVKLASALSNYWTQRINDDFIRTVFIHDEKARFDMANRDEKLRMIAGKRQLYSAIVNRYDPNMEPYQHIFLKRHVIQCDWNFDFFGFWPFYSESKFEAYNTDRKLSLLEQYYLEDMETEVSQMPLGTDPDSQETLAVLIVKIDCLIHLMRHLAEEGLAPSRFFLDTIDVLEHDQLTISQLSDVLQIVLYRELSHIESFFADTYGHFPEKITQALGRENLDYGLDLLSADDEELLYPLVMETVLGNIIAEAHPVFILERFLEQLTRDLQPLRQKSPSRLIFPPESRPLRDLSPVHFGYKAYALITLAEDGFAVPDLQVMPVSFFRENPHLITPEYRAEYRLVLIRHILQLEEKTGKCFAFQPNSLSPQEQTTINNNRSRSQLNPDTAPQLLLSARSGSYRSMPGILGTVVNIGYGDLTKRNDLPESELKIQLNTYRMFLSTFGNVVHDINEIDFSNIVSDIKYDLVQQNPTKTRWEDLEIGHITTIIKRFKELIETTISNLPGDNVPLPDWDDPLSLLADATIGVWNSWNSKAARKLRRFLTISEDWKTAVILMEMKLADQNNRSFSAILFSGDPQGKNNRPHGDILFGRAGEDIAAGLASEGTALESLETDNPHLYKQIVDLLEQVKVNKGNINVDVEMVGEYDPETRKMDLYIVQERQMPLGKRAESEDYRLTPTDTLPAAKGLGVNGGVQYGVFLDGVQRNYYELRDQVQVVRQKLGDKDQFHGPGIFLLMKYVTPEEALKMNIPGVDGVITTRIGKSSHASISAKRDGKLFICEAGVRFNEQGWMINGKQIITGEMNDPDVFTVVANPRSTSPYSGNIYRGKMPLTPVPATRRRRKR